MNNENPVVSNQKSIIHSHPDFKLIENVFDRAKDFDEIQMLVLKIVQRHC